MSSKSSKYKPTDNQKKAIVEFAIANKCVIHAHGMDYFVEGFNEFKRCVCDPERLECPCTEAPQEIIEKGHCLCHLFWKSYEEYLKVQFSA